MLTGADVVFLIIAVPIVAAWILGKSRWKKHLKPLWKKFSRD